MSKIRVQLVRSQAGQDSFRDRPDSPSGLYAVLDANEDQISGLKDYIKAIQDGEDTSDVETEIGNI
jgi:hypothetical protein